MLTYVKRHRTAVRHAQPPAASIVNVPQVTLDTTYVNYGSSGLYKSEWTYPDGGDVPNDLSVIVALLNSVFDTDVNIVVHVEPINAEGTDFVAPATNPIKLLIPAGSFGPSNSVAVQIVPDNIVEPNERLKFRVLGVESATTRGIPAVGSIDRNKMDFSGGAAIRTTDDFAIATIMDEEVSRISLTAATTAIAEGAGPYSFDVTYDGPAATTPFSVTLELSTNANSPNGAKFGDDFDVGSAFALGDEPWEAPTWIYYTETTVFLSGNRSRSGE